MEKLGRHCAKGKRTVTRPHIIGFCSFETSREREDQRLPKVWESLEEPRNLTAKDCKISLRERVDGCTIQ